MGLEGLDAKDPAPAEVALGFACVARGYRPVVAYGFDAVGNGRRGIHFTSYLSHLP